jgi:AhpD family alkylhydroperoxidase
MSHLTGQQRSLVAIGASLGSNCIPCVKFHIRKGQQAGLTDLMIGEALEVAESVRQVPARNVREAAGAAVRTRGEEAFKPRGRGSCGIGDDAPDSHEASGSPCCGPEVGDERA